MGIFGGDIKEINSTTLPEAAKLANDLVTNVVTALNSTITGIETVGADGITQLDNTGNRLLDRFESMVKALETKEIVLNGTVGGIPINASLQIKDIAGEIASS
jgi:hypothetical protein